MSVLIDLTQKGITELKAIIEYCLHYIEMLKEAGPQAWIFEELQAINKMKFEYMEKKKGMMHTARMAKYMHQRKIEELIVYPYLMEKWEPEIIK
jgi:insulysin